MVTTRHSRSRGTYRVFAVNSHGAGPTNPMIKRGTTTQGVSVPARGGCRNLRATDKRYPTKVVVTWEAPADDGGKSIDLDYRQRDGSDSDDSGGSRIRKLPTIAPGSFRGNRGSRSATVDGTH